MTGEPLPEPGVLALFTRARRLEGAVWTLGLAYQCPARYREPARFLLADALGQDDKFKMRPLRRAPMREPEADGDPGDANR